VIDKTNYGELAYKFEIWVDKEAREGEPKRCLDADLSKVLDEQLSFFLHTSSG